MNEELVSLKVQQPFSLVKQTMPTTSTVLDDTTRLSPPLSSPVTKAIAFYLPQYHPTAENDAWWGKGFTEWHNTARAKPNFEGHYQPHAPADLGYYDLRLSETREHQAELAQKYGVYGFCYYFYWFNGKRVLDRPLREMLEGGKPDFPFCVCWANENWTRTWDGLERNILLGQNHTPEDDKAFIQEAIKLFRDDRYIKVNGSPLLLVYRVDLFPSIKDTAALWRAEAKKAGFPNLYLAAVQFYGITDPGLYGFDAAVEFPPHGFLNEQNFPNDLPALTNPKFSGSIFDYDKVAYFALNKPIPQYKLFRGVIPSWDNTPRRQDTPHIISNSSPTTYEYWLSEIVKQTQQNSLLTQEERFVFINAWNEWGEGCHLEPDRKYGHQYLEATRNALFQQNGAHVLIQDLRRQDDETSKKLVSLFDARERSLKQLVKELHLSHQKLSAITKKNERIRRLLTRIINRFPRIKTALKKLLGKG